MTKERITDFSLGVVITGASTGLGWALARGFLAAGDRVVICARDPRRLDAAVRGLQKAVPGGEVHAACRDVSIPEDAESFAAFAASKLGRIDRWINNAGTAGQSSKALWELDAPRIHDVCMTNLGGTLLMCSEALKVMIRQENGNSGQSAHLFNMGFSSLGARMSKSSVPHKASKIGVAMVTKFLASELKRKNIGNIGVHELSPGLVLTDLLLRTASARERKLFNMLAEEPESVASTLVPMIRSACGNGSSIRFRSPGRMLLCFVAGYPSMFSGGRFFDRNGVRIQDPNCQYRQSGALKLFDGDD